ncbi:MAG: methylated-DNA--[protein]-cysteine S-methyltransferase [Gaiellaceae bacterium]
MATRERQRAYLETSLGTLAIEGSEHGLTQIDLLPAGERKPVSAPEPNSVVAKAARQLEEYFSGKRREFDLPLDYEAGGFERQVLDELVRVPYGKTVSYGELAALAGSPRAARAVGNIMRQNPLMIVIPCHRVIGSDGSLRGYGGLGAGLDHKRRLLDFESTSGAGLQSGT